MTQLARKGSISVEELAALPVATGFVRSWDGNRVAFYWNKSGRFEIHVLDLRTRETRQLTDGDLPATPRGGMVWTRDDRAVVFVRDNKGDEQNNLVKVDLDTLAVTQLNDDPRTQEYAGEMHPDNTRMAVTSNRAGQVNVFTLDLVHETHEWRQITSFGAPTSAGSWSPDGRWLSVTSNESSNLKNVDAYLVRDDGSEVRKALSVTDGSRDSISDWHPDGRRVAVTSDASGTSRAGILDLEGGQVRWLTPEGAGYQEVSARFSPDGRWLAAFRDHESSTM
ncbi:MAG TPA: S9 family peptidase, partial [Candidatus Thermoplasmatota archaeon]|nr:S9 family peptidase [Candidatus Thermoplasmatota archaeon]